MDQTANANVATAAALIQLPDDDFAAARLPVENARRKIDRRPAWRMFLLADNIMVVTGDQIKAKKEEKRLMMNASL